MFKRETKGCVFGLQNLRHVSAEKVCDGRVHTRELIVFVC